MKKKFSIFILLLFSAQLSASFLHFDCNMACCQDKIISCCLTEPTEKECPTMSGNCNTVVFLPIISVSTERAEYENKLSINKLIPISKLNETVFPGVLNTINTQLSSKPPAAFNLPLLI